MSARGLEHHNVCTCNTSRPLTCRAILASAKIVEYGGGAGFGSAHKDGAQAMVLQQGRYTAIQCDRCDRTVKHLAPHSPPKCRKGC